MPPPRPPQGASSKSRTAETAWHLIQRSNNDTTTTTTLLQQSNEKLPLTHRVKASVIRQKKLRERRGATGANPQGRWQYPEEGKGRVPVHQRLREAVLPPSSQSRSALAGLSYQMLPLKGGGKALPGPALGVKKEHFLWSSRIPSCGVNQEKVVTWVRTSKYISAESFRQKVCGGRKGASMR